MKSLSEFYHEEEVRKIMLITCSSDGIEEDSSIKRAEDSQNKVNDENLESPAKRRTHLKKSQNEDIPKKRQYSPIKRDKKGLGQKHFDLMTLIRA